MNRNAKMEHPDNMVLENRHLLQKREREIRNNLLNSTTNGKDAKTIHWRFGTGKIHGKIINMNPLS